MTAVFAAVCMAVPSSAKGISTAKVWEDETNVTIKAKADKASTAYLKIAAPGEGTLTFRIYEQKITNASKYELLNSKGKTIKSGKLSSLANKTFNVTKKTTLYLKVKLAKGESVKYFRYEFYTYGAYPTATEKWLTDHEVTDDEIQQLKTSLQTFVLYYGVYFDEGKVCEHQALDFVLDSMDGFVNPYGFDDSEGLDEKEVEAARKEYMNLVSGKAVDDTIYHLFGITPSHKANDDWKYYKNGNYYYGDGAKGCPDRFEYQSYEKTGDGRFIAKYIYYVIDMEKSEDLWEHAVYDEYEVYVLFSVHETDGKNYVRIHGIYDGVKPTV